MKSIVRLLVLVLILSLSSMFATAAEPVKITHLVYTSSGQKVHDYLFSRAESFKKQYGIEVEIIVGNQEKLKTMMAGGVEPDLHDLPDFGHLIEAGYYVNVLPLMQKDGLMKAFNPVMIERMKSPDGGLYRVPSAIASVVGFFNRTLFLEAGVATPLQAEYNWDFVINAGKKLTRDLNGDGAPDTYGADRIWAYWQRAVAQTGGDLYEFNAKGQPIKSLWASPQVEQGIDFVRKMQAEGISPWKRTGSRPEADFNFWMGKSGMDLVDATGILGTYLKDATFDWDISLLPAGPIGPIAAGAGGIGPYIFAKTKHLDAVWQWCKYLYMDRQNIVDMINAVGSIPAYLGAQQLYAETIGISKKNYKAIYEALNYLPQPKTTGTLPANLSARGVNVNDALLGVVPVRQFLEQLDSKMQAIIDDLLKTSK